MFEDGTEHLRAFSRWDNFYPGSAEIVHNSVQRVSWDLAKARIY